jgi:O-Antigen ligase
MSDPYAAGTTGDVVEVERDARWQVRVGLAFVILVGLLIGAVAKFTSPRPLAIGLVLLVLVMWAWIVRPILGLCATLFFTFIGDQFASAWYPFTKGLSSRESMMHLSSKLILSPLDLCMIAGLASIVVIYLRTGRWPLRRGRMDLAVAVFGAFVVIGTMYGIATGGSLYFALFQVRPFFDLFVLYVLTSSFARTTSDYRRMLWAVLAAIEIHALLSWLHIAQASADERRFPEGLVNHSGVMRMNVLIMVVLASWLLKGNSMRLRLVTTLMLIPVMVVYFLTERRAAIVALAIGVLFLLVVTFWRQRSTFRKLAPTLIIITVGYLGAFWSSQSSIGFPAQALKSVIAPTDATSRNQDSDMYRTIETYDLNYTIRSEPLLGIGIGKPFYRPVTLPSLGGFAFNQYIPHNSVLFLWVAFGFGGFAAFFCLLGWVVILGADAVRRAPAGSDLVVALTWLVAPVMMVVFAGVDIAWEHENFVLLGAAVAVISHYPLAKRRRTTPVQPAAPAEIEPLLVGR